ncbi:hypothetical protein FRC10_006021 [Ceratobasidium sp. 414]|nr:hypothetical protein FRC10_006021 [Ceratobasidium sp. 414]
MPEATVTNVSDTIGHKPAQSEPATQCSGAGAPHPAAGPESEPDAVAVAEKGRRALPDAAGRNRDRSVDARDVDERTKEPRSLAMLTNIEQTKERTRV